MSSLLDQSALTDLADRLVAAARRAGADTADALAVRSVSLAVEVREGAVEESERSEGDDVGLRVFVGTRQAVVSTNDVKTDVAQLAERAVAMARAAPEDPFAGLADPAQLARDIPDLDLLDPDLPTVAQLEERAQRAESAGLAVKGVTKSGGASASAGIGGMVLVTSHGFRGAYLNSGQSVSMTAIAGEGTAMERDYDYSSRLHFADLEAPADIGRKAYQLDGLQLNTRWKGDGFPADGVPVEVQAQQLMANLADQTLQLTELAAVVADARLHGELRGQEILDAPRVEGSLQLDPVSPREWLPKLGIQLPQTRDPAVFKTLSFAGNVKVTKTSADLGDVKLQLDDTTATGSLAP
jgi:hypothetical protein